MPREQRFDPSALFVVTKAFKCQGREFRVGEPFDMALVPPHRLRQMVQATRQVRQVEAAKKPKAKIEVGSPILNKPETAATAPSDGTGIIRRRPVTTKRSETPAHPE